MTKKGKKRFMDRDDLIPGVDYSWSGMYSSIPVERDPDGWKRRCEECPERNPVLRKARSARVKRIRRLLWEAVRREDGYELFLELIDGQWLGGASYESDLDEFFRFTCPEEWERLCGLKSEDIVKEQQEGEIAVLLERLRGENGPEVLRKVLVQVRHNRFEDALNAGRDEKDG
ncbi:MAG: hypothetical protein QF415_17365 [Candidatus Undinarchaeales archaeon]|jgi:bifunctional DNA-binding transcriptional regulator/antitoxin component of YhaV-PrlF toxin-antitoxin module|nr:hypothetical protein [Candidatus Undinarchaeales archaeon]MDP7494663.1 hypothetical protein [Candidatus Undinarchaeales archaeon]